METVTVAEYENVNGFKLALKVDESGPKSITFTVTYKNGKIKCNWSRVVMILTLILYAASFIYTYMTLKSVLACASIIFVMIIFWGKRTVKSESLTVVPTVGLQSSVKYVFGQEERFVPWSNIDDLIINEVIKMNRVLYFLSVLVKPRHEQAGEEPFNILPLFQYTKPRLQMIEKIYSEISQVIAKQLESCEAQIDKREQAAKATKKDTTQDHTYCTHKYCDHGDEGVEERDDSEDSFGDIG